MHIDIGVLGVIFTNTLCCVDNGKGRGQEMKAEFLHCLRSLIIALMGVVILLFIWMNMSPLLCLVVVTTFVVITIFMLIIHLIWCS